MHQTTIRFGSDLWEALERECAELGVSVAQYLREAALARLMYAAGRRGDPALEAALMAAIESEETQKIDAEVELAQSSAGWGQGREGRRREDRAERFRRKAD